MRKTSYILFQFRRVNARKVLVNLGLINAMDLYGPNVHKAGETVNKKVRALKPVPVN